LETDTLLLSIQSINWGTSFQHFSLGLTVTIVVLIFLLILSALISGAEVAYFSIGETEKQQLKKSKKKDVRALNMLETPEKLLSTMLVANSFINVAIVVISVYLINQTLIFQNQPVIRFLIQILSIAFIVLLFGEILPKIYASHYKIRLIRFMISPLVLMEKLFNPFNKFLASLSVIVSHRLKKHTENFSIDDISQALKGKTEEELSEEKEILEGIVKFGNKNVAEIMKSRVDVISLDIKNNFSTVLEVIVDSGFSRIPVYIDSFDNIKGILYIKDILPHSHKANSFKWQLLIRPPFYVPETKKINSLLKEFQKNKVHLAVVIDEYGGTSGIVTLEDVLEEIVGEIVDEFDEEENFFSEISEDILLFDGKILLGDFYKITKCSDNIFDQVKGDADTLAGLILELKGEIPVKNEKIEFENFIFTIEQADDRRIIQIKVEINRNKESEG
jgi:gliding motility-associated protein GldE